MKSFPDSGMHQIKVFPYFFVSVSEFIADQNKSTTLYKTQDYKVNTSPNKTSGKSFLPLRLLQEADSHLLLQKPPAVAFETALFF